MCFLPQRKQDYFLPTLFLRGLMHLSLLIPKFTEETQMLTLSPIKIQLLLLYKDIWVFVGVIEGFIINPAYHRSPFVSSKIGMSIFMNLVCMSFCLSVWKQILIADQTWENEINQSASSLISQLLWLQALYRKKLIPFCILSIAAWFICLNINMEGSFI